MRRIILVLVASSSLLFRFSQQRKNHRRQQQLLIHRIRASQARRTREVRRAKQRVERFPSFLILGTVFNENAISFPDVQVRIRRTGEKKFRWDAYTNSRGEFAVRVPPGYEYEVVTHVKKYEDQSQTVDSKVDVQQRLSIKLQPKGQTKTGAKP